MVSIKTFHCAAGRLAGFMSAERSAIVLAMLLCGWGVPLRAAPPPDVDPFQELRAQDLRVASVSYRLATANRASCGGAVAPQLGFTLHGIEQYEVADRDRVGARFALGRHAGVMAVVPLSPADKAGLKADDQLVSVNGRVIGPGAGDRRHGPTRAFVERSQETILEEMKTGTVTLRVSGAGVLRDVRFVAELGCTSNVELVPGDDVNAWADGERVVVSAGLLARCTTDDDLALVIAHELAHNLLGHSRKRAASGSSKGTVMKLLGTGPAMMRAREEEADRLAVRMATAAAYDMAHTEMFMKGLLNGRKSTADAGTHPSPDRRLAVLRAEIARARAMSPERRAR
jgi:hypothetical protein